MISAEEFLARHPVAVSTEIGNRDAGSKPCMWEADVPGTRHAMADQDGSPDVAGFGSMTETPETDGEDDATVVRNIRSSFARRHGSGASRRPSHARWGSSPAGSDRSGRRRYGKWGGAAPAGDGDVDPTDADACREAALHLLDAAPRASGALRRRLVDKGYAEQTADEVVERLIEVRLLDDEEYARSAVRYCAGRLMGRRATVMELVRKGVGQTLAEDVAAQAAEQGVFEDAAWELGRRYAGKSTDLDSDTCKRRFWSAGGRKGHDPQTLARIAHELFD